MTKNPSSSQRLSIKDWADSDRPREKMISQGKAVLTNAELLAILIGSGSASESAVALSQRILASVANSLTALGKLTLPQLLAFKGIGQAKAITILAATELGRRRSAETPEPLPKIERAEDVFSLMQPLIGELPHEEFWVYSLVTENGLGARGGLYDLDTQPSFREPYPQQGGYPAYPEGQRGRTAIGHPPLRSCHYHREKLQKPRRRGLMLSECYP